MPLGGMEQTKANSFNFVRGDTTVAWSADPAACTAHSAAAGIDPSIRCGSSRRTAGPLHHRHRRLQSSRDRAGQRRAQPSRSSTARRRRARRFHRRHAARAPQSDLRWVRRWRRTGRGSSSSTGRPFAREEAWTAAFIAGLRGRVLDVAAAASSSIATSSHRWCARAPCGTPASTPTISLDRIRAALPDGRFYVGGIEDFRGEPASYDHLLCLRSLNHVFDLDEALARMSALLGRGIAPDRRIDSVRDAAPPGAGGGRRPGADGRAPALPQPRQRGGPAVRAPARVCACGITILAAW